jgi:two-component system cell cycle response regulator
MRVLVADDSVFHRRALGDMLTEWQYEIVLAEDGAQALKVLQDKDAPRLALLDCVMPAMSGLEVCNRIRSSETYTYVILVSAQRERADVLKGFEIGADDYICKPVDRLELQARLKVGERIIRMQDQLLESQRQLARQASCDSLTQLWNHGAIVKLLGNEIRRSKRNSTPLSICLLDLDHFKEINDTHGHLTGDLVLQSVARAIVESVRIYDVVGRYGGEEFVAVFPGCKLQEALVIAERIREQIRAKVTANSELEVTASIGLAEWKPDTSATALLSLADAAMYRAKNAGRNRVEVTP